MKPSQPPHSTRRAALRTLAGVAALPSALAQPAPAAGAAAAQADASAVLNARLRVQGVGYVSLQTDASGARFAAAGRVDARQPAAPDADTRFEWGSITKTFTALLLADMVVRGDLKLEDAVETALPTGLRLRDSAGEPIRWVDLATHRSGLPRLPTGFVPPDLADPYAAFDTARLESFIASWKPTVPRNARYEYSNLAYGLLGHALGRRAGQGFATALRTQVLLPLGLGDVALRERDTPVARAAQGHDALGSPVPPWRFDALAGAGALVGSARELARYAQCASDRTPHPLQAAFRLALQRHADGPAPGNPSGLGWILGPLNGRPVANHDGGTFGFSSSLFIDLQQGRSAGVLANAFVPVNDMALHLLDASVPLRDVAAEQATERAARDRPALALPADALQALAGVYALNPQFKLTLTQREGRLFAQASGQGEFELFAAAPRRFFARVAALEIAFDGAEGVPAALTLLQAGQALRFLRE